MTHRHRLISAPFRLRRTLLVVALSAALAAGSAQAQSTVGSIFGEAGPGTVVTIENLDTGTTRQITADDEGRYAFGQLPTGRYRVSADGQARDVTVQVGTGTNVDLLDAQTLEVVEITGSISNPIDVSSVESTTIYTAEQLEKLPVARDISSVALLAPGTVRGDSGFNPDASGFPSDTPLASFGGASVAENGYYINGFDVTNVRDFLSYATLPFGAIAEQQVKTGGYGAEFGRSLGGVVNLVTKRGTNDWQFGGAMYYSPSWGQASGRDVRNRDTGEGAAEFYQYRSANETDSASVEVYGGGALVEDKLFLFALLEAPYLAQDRYDRHDSVARKNTQPRGMVKLDWNITDDHLLELTGISHRYKFRDTAYHNPDHEEFTGEHGERGLESETERGGEVYIARYTGYLTDSFTVSALGGYLNYVNDHRTPESWPGAECPRVYDSRANPVETVYRGCWDESQPNILRTPGFGPDEDTRTSFRIDADWQIGDHLLRFGYDRAEFTSKAAGTNFIGPNGLYYRYFNTDTRPLAGVPAGTDYVRTWYDVQSAGEYEQINTALYVEDSWQVTDNFLAYLGLRQETFENLGGDGVAFIENDDLIGPRLGLSWDVRGDSSWKVFANAGRYFLPIATNTNIRATRVEYRDESYWTFAGIDPVTYAPTGLVRVAGPFVTGSTTPADPLTIADQQLDPMYQDEYILGTQFALGGQWSMGIRGISREVKSGVEDYCGHNAFNEWAEDNGYDPDFALDEEGIDMAGCMIINPGRDVTLAMDPDNDGDLETFTVSNDYLQLPEYKRSYRAVELTFEKPLSDGWAFQGSYTWSKSYGNVEGSVNSTLEQEDPGATQDFDFLPFTYGIDGYLPNDRRHSFKFNGLYELSDEWRLGANAVIQSGRPVSCNGFVPLDQLGIDYPDYGTIVNYAGSSFYCPDPDSETMVLTKRGDFGRTPWTYEFDLSVAYVPSWANQQLTLQLDVFNLLNFDKVTEYNEFSQVVRPTEADPAPVDPNFLNDVNYQTPRSIRLSARYHW